MKKTPTNRRPSNETHNNKPHACACDTILNALAWFFGWAEGLAIGCCIGCEDGYTTNGGFIYKMYQGCQEGCGEGISIGHMI